MNQCFVIQPFDNDKFDKRFVDIFEPAIVKANHAPYRIDKDLSVRIPIDEIEKGIIESSICFAEITTDNPNVWYELGFAIACRKDVVMVCSDERVGKFPFDIHHRHIISYRTSSTSDFTMLEQTITKRIIALQEKTRTVDQLSSNALIETEGLKGHEIAILILIMQNQISDEDSYSLLHLRNEMNKSGYTEIATSIGVRTLSQKGFLVVFKTSDEYSNGQEYFVCRLTSKGEQWVLGNQEHITFRQVTKINKYDKNDDLPF